VSELFAAPGSAGRTFERCVADAGRVEAIWYPFTDRPWLKVWSISPRKPPSSRAVTGAYNYPLSDQIPEPVAKLARRIVLGDAQVTPEFGLAEYAVTAGGLAATDSADLWGPAKDTQLYIRASTLRYDEFGYSIMTRRADLQRDQPVHKALQRAARDVRRDLGPRRGRSGRSCGRSPTRRRGPIRRSSTRRFRHSTRPGGRPTATGRGRLGASMRSTRTACSRTAS
jgi:hypothetical protein